MGMFTSTFPPLTFVLGPWLLLGLLLSGPFLVLLTVVFTALAIPAVLALPFLLVRRLRTRRVPVAAPRRALELREVTA